MDKRGSECRTHGNKPDEKETAVVRTHEKTWRVRAHATVDQHDSTRRMTTLNGKTMAKISGHHQEGHECELNGEGRSGSGEVGRSNSTGYPLRIWPAKLVTNATVHHPH